MNGLQLAKAALHPEGEPSISLARWRQIAPALARLSPDERAERLAALNIEPAQWERAESYWSLTVAEHCARGDRARIEELARAGDDESPAPAPSTRPEGARHHDSAPGSAPDDPTAPPSPAAAPTPALSAPTGGETAFLSPFAVPEPALPFTPVGPGTSPRVTYGSPPPARPATGTMEIDPDVLRSVLLYGPGKAGSGR